MANRHQDWGMRGRHGQHDRWEPDNERHRVQHDRPWEQRSFGQEGRFSSEADRHGPGTLGRRFDRPYEPWRAEPRGSSYGGGQAYGLEGGRQHEMREERRRDRDEERESWSPGGGEPYGDLELNPRNRGIREFGPPADYAYHPQAGHEFDPEYLHWRDEQMRGHDRDYRDWRRAQQDRYDEDYRRFRAEREARRDDATRRR